MDAITITLAFLVFAIVMFAWEKIPLSITAMITAVGLYLTGVLTPAEAFKGFVDSNVLLFIGMFIVGAAFFETGMAVAVGRIVSKFAKSETQLIIAIMLLTGVMSGFLSNTGTAAIMIPVVLGIAKETGYSPQKLLMTLVFAASLGGNRSLIGSPGNMIAQSNLISHGIPGFGFFDYGYVGLPLLLAGTIFYAFIGKRFLPDQPKHRPDVNYTKHYNYDHVPVWKKWVAGLVLLGTIVMMILEKETGIPLFVSAWLGALIIVATGTLTEKQAMAAIDMTTIFLFVGSLAIGKAMVKSGAGELMADQMVAMIGDHASEALVLVVISVVSVLMTNFMSNTATCALLVPIGLHLSTSMGFDPHGLMAAIVISSSLACGTPVGTPANTMVYNVAGYSFIDFVKAGTPLILVSMIVVLLLVPLVFPF